MHMWLPVLVNTSTSRRWPELASVPPGRTIRPVAFLHSGRLWSTGRCVGGTVGGRTVGGAVERGEVGAAVGGHTPFWPVGDAPVVVVSPVLKPALTLTASGDVQPAVRAAAAASVAAQSVIRMFIAAPSGHR